VSFRVNKSFTNRLRNQILARREEVLLSAGLVMSEAVALGGAHLQDYLEAAVTRTGEFREAYLGGLPGRHDTGNMVGSVSYEGDDGQPFEQHGDVRVFAFGWFKGDFEDYFYAQDTGEGNIPAANAMEAAYEDAKQYVRGRMPAAVR
jgi:hypothetical protein